MDGTCSNKSKAWREKKLSWLNVSAPQWSHVVTVGHGSPFDYPSASMHIGKNKRNKPLAAGIAIYTSSCHLFAGHDPDFFSGSDDKGMCSRGYMLATWDDPPVLNGVERWNLDL